MDKRDDNFKRITNRELALAFIESQVKELKEELKDEKVLLALSGGVDSSVVAALLIKAIGKNLVCIHVNHGLLRKNESESVIKTFKEELGATLIYVDAVDRFLGRLEGVEDPEAKRKIIGDEFINVFAEEASKLEGIKVDILIIVIPGVIHHTMSSFTPQNFQLFHKWRMTLFS